MHTKRTPKQVIQFAEEADAKLVDLKFIDWPGIWNHCTYPLHQIDVSAFEEGLGFDGSSIRGWQSIDASDMLMMPDPNTAFIDPFCDEPTVSMICDIVDPITREPYSRDPRHIAKKAASYVELTGIGDTAYFGPEAEFFIFDDVRFHTDESTGFYSVDSVEGRWNSGRE